MDQEQFKRAFIVAQNSNTPIYLQLSNFLRLQIKSNVLKPGEKMIPEEDLCRILNISRTTVRQAINLLVEQGLLVRFRGKGTFVSEQKFSRSFNHLYNFSSDMRAIGVKPSSRVLVQEVVDTRGSYVQEALELSDDNARAFHLLRVRYADEKAVIIENTYLPYFLCQGIENFNFEKSSLYEVLKNNYNLTPYQAIETLRAIVIPPKEQAILNCKNNMLGYQIHRIARLESSYIYEYTSSITRADLCSYQFTLSNTGASKSNSNLIMRMTDGAGD